jgi:hypothetical protein
MNVVTSGCAAVIGLAWILMPTGAAAQGAYLPAGAGPAIFLRAGIGGVVTNAPYSADVISTVTQVLADGTRIELSVTGKVYRDAAGRMRREQQVLGLDGLLRQSRGPVPVITITDPTTQTTFTIDDGTRTARKQRYTAVLQFDSNGWSTGATWFTSLNSPDGGSLRLRVLQADLAAIAASADRAVTLQRQGAGGGRGGRTGGSPTAGGESLGSRQMEGVLTNGTRVTQTIPTGQIGNDRPIVITDETWVSPDLQVLVYSKHHDPRTGDVEYRLRNISRNDPPANLFQVPAGYTVVDPGDALTGGGGRGRGPAPAARGPGQ